MLALLRVRAGIGLSLAWSHGCRLRAVVVLLPFLAGCAIGTGAGRATDDSGPPVQLLTILATTDVHGRIRAWDYYTNDSEPARGLSRAATIVDSVRSAAAGGVILLDAGDLLQGNPFAYVAARIAGDTINPIVAAMNLMRYDAAAIGNHEYNYGVPYLERAVAQARFAFLSANTYRMDGSHAFRPWTIVERQGIRIGIVGATTPGVLVWDRDNVAGRLTFGPIVPAVARAVEEVRTAGADVVLVTMHSGLDEPASYDTVSTGVPSENVAARVAREVPGIDLIVFGHSHKELAGQKLGNTLLLQPKNWAASVGVAHLRLVREGATWRVTDSRSEIIQSAGHAESPAVVQVVEAAHSRAVAYATEPIGSTPVAWRADSARLIDTPIIDLIQEIQKKAANAELSSSAAFSLEATLGPGPITVAQLARLYPYDNTLRAVRVSGSQLREYLEFSSRYYVSVDTTDHEQPLVTDPEIPGYNFDVISGADYTLDLTRPAGSRVTALTFRGRAVADMDSFTLALNNYRQTGGGGYAMLRGSPVVHDRQEEIRQLLIDEVRARGTMKPEDYFTRNWRLAYPGAPAAHPASLRIIATNDFHGALEPRPDASGVIRGGAAYVAAMIDSAARECAPGCEVLIVDGGDLFQGTPASNFAFGKPVVEYYNRIGYAAAALGNHEFDWGTDTLRARMREARFAILGANVRFTDGRDVPWIPDDTLIVRGPLTIGVIGAATVETARTSRRPNIAGMRFDEPAPIISARARSLRERGADVVVVLVHSGAFCSADGQTNCRGEVMEIARDLSEPVDAIVSGHLHSLMDVVVNGTPIVQARSRGSAIAIIDIPLTGSRPAGTGSAEIRDVLPRRLQPHPGVDSLVSAAVARVAPRVNRRVARIAVPLRREGNQYPLGNLVADAQRWAGKGDIAIVNNGSIRTGLRAGPLTYGALYEMHPFGNTLYRIRMRGSQVREYLERIVSAETPRMHVSGVAIGYNPELPRGERIVSLRLPAGRTLSEGAVYDVIVSDFLALGGDNMAPPEGVIRVTPLDVVDIDAIISYLRTLPAPVRAPREPRIFISQ